MSPGTKPAAKRFANNSDHNSPPAPSIGSLPLYEIVAIG